MKPDKASCLTDANKSFCMFPWVHSNIHTTGQVRLCCIDQKPKGVGYISKTSSWADVWNDRPYRTVRLKMLAGEPVEHCQLCYRNEQLNGHSYRMDTNRTYAHLFDETVGATEEDGSAPMNIKYLDIRWSNICNLKCRMCNATFSSLIATENRRTLGRSGLELEGLSDQQTYVAVTEQRADFLSEIADYLDTVETIYFAGGEPLVTPEHYLLLEMLIERKLANKVTIVYNTNLTRLKYKQWNVLGLWPQFKNVSLQPSLDSWGSRAEYLRTGTVWTEIEANIQQLRNVAPVLSPTVTVGGWNILTYTDFYQYMLDRFNMTPDQLVFRSNVLTDPWQMSMAVLTPELKAQAIKKLEQFANRYGNFPQVAANIQPLINELNTEATVDSAAVKQFIDNFDNIRNTSFADTFPELKDWYNEL